MKTSIALVLVSILPALANMSGAGAAEAPLAHESKAMKTQEIQFTSFQSLSLDNDKQRLEAEMDKLLEQTGPLSDQILRQRRAQLTSDPDCEALAFNVSGL